ncbi:carboxymuconolactone decarboxylase family protein [Halobacillus litoralis]|uniref:carboxymuconolactone decarboxylase family protein n=1 Tax=Halobacillus litoralis TaxID=45668 RepID=UPI001CFF4959|nr:peroxidase-related enzyme [Halobacillus litoralis]
MTWIRPIKQKKMKELDIRSDVPQPATLFDRLLANDPSTYEAFLPLQKAVKNTSLSEGLREAVITFVSMKNGCQYCTKSHAQLLEAHIERQDVLQWLQDYSSSTMSDEWKAALIYAERLTAKPVEVSKEDVERLIKQGFDEQQIMELNQTIAYTSYTNQISIGLGL